MIIPQSISNDTNIEITGNNNSIWTNMNFDQNDQNSIDEWINRKLVEVPSIHDNR
jgi:hypothetical protein